MIAVSFPFDLEPNGVPLSLKSKGKLPPRPYPIQPERKWKYSFLSADKSCVQLYIVMPSINGRLNEQ